MLETQAIITYFHFAGIIALFIALWVEYILFKPNISNQFAKVIRRADAVYGIASGVIMATGFAKLLKYGKGADYYWNNHLLWGKMILFTLIGVLSIIPTIYFFKWKNEVNNGNDILVPDLKYKKLKAIIFIEIIIASSIPLLAVFMARGFGYVE